MATRIAVGIMREQAMNAIADATGKIASAMGIDAPVIPIQGKDADLLYAQQLTAIADYLNSVAAQIAPAPTMEELLPEMEPVFVQSVVENDPPIPDDAPKARRKGR